MARKAPKLTVDYTPEAREDLADIWDWNAGKHGFAHANAYVELLQEETDRLDVDYHLGKLVPSHNDWRYQIIRRNNKGHGHIVIYEVSKDIVRVLRYFHTAQDWQNKLTIEQD